jgi:hypothetical protein
MDEEIRFRQIGFQPITTIPPRSQFVFPGFFNIRKKKEQEKLLQIQLEGSNSTWSSGFSLQSLGEFVLKLKKEGTNQPILVGVEVTQESATVLIKFQRKAEEEFPYEIRNNSSFTFQFQQKVTTSPVTTTTNVEFQRKVNAVFFFSLSV